LFGKPERNSLTAFGRSIFIYEVVEQSSDTKCRIFRKLEKIP
jgi:hypothetical protein